MSEDIETQEDCEKMETKLKAGLKAIAKKKRDINKMADKTIASLSEPQKCEVCGKGFNIWSY